MAPADAADPLEMECAWHLLTVVVRLGRPAAVSDLAAIAGISPRIVERMCHIPDSPLCISDGGAVTASQTAFLTILRFVGLDVPAPRVSLRPADVRRWWGITYVRKRKASDGRPSGGKRRCLLAPDADLVEHKQPEALQLTTQSCAPVVNGEVHMGIILGLQNRLPTVGSFVGEPIEISTGLTVVPSVSEISIAYAQPRVDQSPRGDDGTVMEKAAPALVPTELSASPFGINLLSLDAEKSNSIHAATNIENRTGESDEVPFHNRIVEDSDDLEKSPVLPRTVHTVLVGAKKDGIEKDLNPFREKPDSPINRNTKTADNMEIVNMIPNQADTMQHDSPNAGYHENAPTLNQEKNPLSASGCVKIHKKETQILLQPPTDTKLESLLPEMNRNFGPAAFPQEATRYNRVNKRNLNSTENRENMNLNHGEKTRNEGVVTVAKNGQDRKIVKQREKSKKYDGLPLDDKNQLAAKVQKGHVAPKPLPSFDGFVIEEEEGSGGYGTVYRARRQGIVHRDVKPGNFLFSRKMMKGYLIDFNLANDLNQKFLKNCKSETISCGKDKVSQPSSSLALVVHAKEATADVKQPLPSKRKRSNRSPVGSTPKIDNNTRHGSQAADASGVTSAKDPTSTKTSLDRLKQPMLYKGRKELMNFLHETMQSPKKDTTKAPVSQRKRVAAPFGSVNKNLFVLTPMPLRSGGSSVAGSGMFNNKGHGKHRREGPCVGTKGFRAPEGCKVDVWSAGVTLLYFIIGRTPFGGDPEQNIKEIAKLRGSEELWEVAKLHNCESSYPSDLFDIKSLYSLDLREWCAANTRRPEFLKMIPDSLFDLVDKCLAVNPRCRLTSEDALMHEFFAPVRDSLRKLRVPRRLTLTSVS
ncbi:hypothetical protein PR202_ga07861 [Eleusine coracana subsp. coracana]|uniref:non-specific serine/threonine protein kinase n=1 Tax=Eleusine coracana subsp. coracana TaxID=191504 RepID=A0AAV5BYU9_ELECO|nr:hypothetical protein PR202_ga07861 [Eleusine coracana subsp. coracana]